MDGVETLMVTVMTVVPWIVMVVVRWVVVQLVILVESDVTKDIV